MPKKKKKEKEEATFPMPNALIFFHESRKEI